MILSDPEGKKHLAEFVRGNILMYLSGIGNGNPSPFLRNDNDNCISLLRKADSRAVSHTESRGQPCLISRWQGAPGSEDLAVLYQHSPVMQR